MNRRIILLALATAAAGAGLLAPSAQATACVAATESNTDSGVKVCVYDDGTSACGGHVGDVRFFCVN